MRDITDKRNLRESGLYREIDTNTERLVEYIELLEEIIEESIDKNNRLGSKIEELNSIIESLTAEVEGDIEPIRDESRD